MLSSHQATRQEVYRPLFGYIAASLSMSERVEATVSKVVLRIVGTIIGSTAGFGVMSNLGLATSPVALVALVCAASFAAGCLCWNQFRVRNAFQLKAYIK